MSLRSLLPWPALLTLALLGCDSSSGPGGGGSGLTATVDGAAWEAEPISIVAQVNAGVGGTLMILGSQTKVVNKTLSLTITIYNFDGVGKYPLGTSIDLTGGIALVGEGTGEGGGKANSWITAGTGLDGELEVTSVDGGRIVGAFHYTVEPGAHNTVGGNREVTEGKFDLPYNGTITALKENAGGHVTALLNGVPYNAATAYAGLDDFLAMKGMQFSSTNSLNGISINMVGVTDTGAYALNNASPQRLLNVGRNGGDADHCCWGTMPGDVGEIIVTERSAKRIKGTFTATLKPAAGKGGGKDLVVTDGSFDLGIP